MIDVYAKRQYASFDSTHAMALREIADMAKTGFDDAIAKAQAAHNHSLVSRLVGERAAARRLVKAALAKGYALRVFDGEAYVSFGKHVENGLLNNPATFTRDKHEAMAALFSTDQDTVHVWNVTDTTKTRVGWFYLIYGNSPEELIANHTANDACQALYDAAHETGVKLQKR